MSLDWEVVAVAVVARRPDREAQDQDREAQRRTAKAAEHSGGCRRWPPLFLFFFRGRKLGIEMCRLLLLLLACFVVLLPSLSLFPPQCLCYSLPRGSGTFSQRASVLDGLERPVSPPTWDGSGPVRVVRVGLLPNEDSGSSRINNKRFCESVYTTWYDGGWRRATGAGTHHKAIARDDIWGAVSG